MNLQNYVALSNNQVTTTSQKVAEAFGKEHRNILQSVKSLNCSDNFRSANFSAHPYTHPQNGETYTYYEMTKDGFMFLVMGFTGKKAAAIKEAYINAFNVMANELQRLSQQPEVPRLEAPSEIDEIVKIQMGTVSAAGFEANGTTWVPENFMWRLFFYSSPAYFRKLFLCNQHKLPEGSYFEVDIDESVMSKNDSLHQIAKEKGQYMIFNLDAIQALALISPSCPTAWLMEWVVSEVKRHAEKKAASMLEVPQRFIVTIEGGNQQVKPIPNDAFVASGHELPKFIPSLGLDNGLLEEVVEVSNNVLHSRQRMSGL